MDSLEVAEFELFFGSSVYDKTGKTVKLTWDALVEKLSIHTVKTSLSQNMNNTRS